jgi:hypothetical protein
MAEPAKTAPTQKQLASTLDFMQVDEIRDSVLVLKESQIRVVISVSSANFALKSTKEQDVIISTFQGVLNSLEEPIQILVQSRKLDLTNYIDKLKRLEDDQTNDLLKLKMQEYITYIQQMIQQINIMSKQFYVIVGFEPIEIKTDGFSRLQRVLSPARYIRQDEEKFKHNRGVAMAKADNLASKLRQLDLNVRILKTEELIGLMYNSYNPDTLESVRINDISALDIEDYSAQDLIVDKL